MAQRTESKRTKLTATCYASRKPWYYITNIYFFNALITVLSLTIFAWDVERAVNRIGGTFTLILTSVSYKTAWSRTMPTISYMTSVDKYQVASIFYLVLCCIWHSSIASLNIINADLKYLLDKIALGMFALFFLTIQLITVISVVVSYKKLKVYKENERNFLSKVEIDDSDDEELY